MARLDKVKVKPDVMQSPSKKRKHEDSGDESDEPLAARWVEIQCFCVAAQSIQSKDLSYLFSAER